MESTNLIIYKYQLKPGENLVEMPPGAKLLHVAGQGSRAFVWALVEPAPVLKRKIATVATGQTFVPEDSEYVGTFHITDPASGELVFHVFDYGERREIF